MNKLLKLFLEGVCMKYGQSGKEQKDISFLELMGKSPNEGGVVVEPSSLWTKFSDFPVS